MKKTNPYRELFTWCVLCLAAAFGAGSGGFTQSEASAETPAAQTWTVEYWIAGGIAGGLGASR
jgi:hypothetical protein